MRPGRGQQQRPLHRLLAPHLLEIHLIGRLPTGLRRGQGRGGGEGQAPGQKIHHLGQGVHRVELQALDHRGFPGVFPGEDEP